MNELPFKHLNKNEFKDSELITNLIIFAHNFYLDNKQDGNITNSNIHHMNVDNHMMINSN